MSELFVPTTFYLKTDANVRYRTTILLTIIPRANEIVEITMSPIDGFEQEVFVCKVLSVHHRFEGNLQTAIVFLSED